MMELLLAAEDALALGDVDQAERTYRQVLESDPRNGIAAVGLARVALERGDEAGAIRLARAALDIDPENATAGRMIDRPEEVARFRGELARPAGDLVWPAGHPVADDRLRLAHSAGPGGAPPSEQVEHPAGAPPPGAPPAAPQPGTAPPPAAPPAVAAPRPVAPPPDQRPQPSPARSGLLRRLLRRP